MTYLIVASILAVDQLSKYFISQSFSLHQSVPLIPGIVHLTLVHNRGAAFGILKNQLPLFVVISVACLWLVGRHLAADRSQRISRYTLSLLLIVAGGLGNLIDRLRCGYVIDFIDLRIWPVFNVADSAISIGAVLLAWSLFFPKKDAS